MAATPRTSIRAGLAMACFSCFLLFNIAMATVNRLDFVKANVASPPSVIVVYNHEDGAPPNATAITVVPAQGSTTPTGFGFGAVSVIANVLRESVANDSAVLGQVAGLTIVEKDTSFYVSVTYVLNTPSYSGSIAAQGKTDDVYGNGEVVITGGTRDFRFVRGYVVLRYTGLWDFRHAVYETTFYLKYD